MFSRPGTSFGESVLLLFGERSATASGLFPGSSGQLSSTIQQSRWQFSCTQVCAQGCWQLNATILNVITDIKRDSERQFDDFSLASKLRRGFYSTYFSDFRLSPDSECCGLKVLAHTEWKEWKIEAERGMSKPCQNHVKRCQAMLLPCRSCRSQC